MLRKLTTRAAGIVVWFLLGLFFGVMIEQWYVDNFSDQDDGAQVVQMVQS